MSFCVGQQPPGDAEVGIEKFKGDRVGAIGLLLGYGLIFAPALLAQPRIDLSPAQAQLSAAVDNLDANAAREAVRAGADPNYRYGPRGHSVLGTVGLIARGLPIQVPLPGLMERVSTEDRNANNSDLRSFVRIGSSNWIV